MKELRYNIEQSVRVSESDGKRYLSGYAAVFNSKSRLIYERGKFFYECISPRAFDNVLQSGDLDVVMTFNHKQDSVIGRTTSGTLTLAVDEVGLRFTVEVPNTTLGNDTYEMVQRGDYNQCSFTFSIPEGGDKWSRDDSGDAIRTVNEISRLYDVCICSVNGAYAETNVEAEYAARCIAELDKDEAVDESEVHRKRRYLEYLKIKNR